jgi:hypothetical protein
MVSFTAALVGIMGVYTFGLFTGIPLDWLTRDPSAVTGSGFYIGMLSNLGMMLWSATTAICFFGTFLPSRSHHFRQPSFFLPISGILCLILTLDDGFMLHERVFPRLLHIPEIGIFLGYLIIFAGYSMYFFRWIVMTDYLLLILALLFLGLSTISDQIFPFSSLETFMEDSLKFLGIVFWLAYFSRAAFVAIHDSSTSG